MKKIGIATFFPNNNYGCLLQAFSLQNLLAEFGFDAEVISFEPNWTHFTVKRDLLHIAYAVLSYWKRHFNLKKWSIDGIKCSKMYHSVKNLENESYDILIAGSDQIWHPSCFAQLTGGHDFYFLNFCNSARKRIAYAPSLCVMNWPKSFLTKTIPFLDKFDAISVRESSSAEYLIGLGYKKTTCVCDPVILHDANFYIKNFCLSIKKSNENAFVFLIRENVPEKLKSTIALNAYVFSIKKTKNILSIPMWLNNILNAEYVVTDSYHCFVFCLLFHKKFLLLKNTSSLSSMNERFVSLLERIGLTERLINACEKFANLKEIIDSPIDWCIVDVEIKKMREFSINWLKKALES